ncbi:MAG: MoaD/ThiS family protein [Candidatus Thorarchaeota archaeon]|nr:MoaD/ThiS family protein [Candidatus Thorarchaeota archaeon]
MPRVTVRFFATVREVTGERSVEVEASTVREMLAVLGDRFGRRFTDTVMDTATGEMKRFYSCMVNGKRIELLNGLDTTLQDGDAVAVFPPVGGG